MYNLKKFYKNKKILVTGATGFKGAWLCSWLLKLNAKIYGIGYNPNQNRNLFYNLKLHKKIKLSIADVRDYKKISNIFKKIKPSINEIKINPRSRSAVMRVFSKL